MCAPSSPCDPDGVSEARGIVPTTGPTLVKTLFPPQVLHRGPLLVGLRTDQD
jgi:hypothetical protein